MSRWKQLEVNEFGYVLSTRNHSRHPGSVYKQGGFLRSAALRVDACSLPGTVVVDSVEHPAVGVAPHRFRCEEVVREAQLDAAGLIEPL